MEPFAVFEKIIDQVEKLQDQGIDVTVSKFDKDYDPNETRCLPRALWRKIEFRCANKAECAAVYAALRALGMLCIYFYVGGNSDGVRAWSVDWSTYTTKEEDAERMLGLEQFERITMGEETIDLSNDLEEEL